MRPAAFSRGAMRNPTSPEVSARPVPSSATSSSAFSPGLTGARKASNPSLANTRFSPVKGHSIGDRGDGDHLHERHQQTRLIRPVKQFLHERLRRLESYAASAQRLTGIAASWLVGI